ncbi:transmembrane 4 L6 family member 4 [Engraulis encrasicolus]|uniref:transmembrane 4 L6 family member 4 n=1 Tax=Engraulis encrasicolus TaxID=184585 RepID=UPI002FD5E5C2
MCSGSCAKCLGITLIPLAILCLLCNIMLFFPGGYVADNNEHISDEVWYMGGIIGSGALMIFPALVFLGLKNNDCCGCCGNESCGKRFAMFTSIIFAAIGVLGAGYSIVVSCVAINRGPLCQQLDNTWGYPLVGGEYVTNHTSWDLCVAPERVVPWHVTLFCMILVMSLVQVALCAFQAINGLIGTICGDCCGCCGSDDSA